MLTFHRFCSSFPALIAVLLVTFTLIGCSAPANKHVWNNKGQAAPTSPSPSISNTSSPYFPSPQGFPSPSTNTVKAAILLPLSGTRSSVGQSMLQAAQLAVFDSGNSNFELMPFDTLGTASGAAVAANSALSNGVQVILGPLFAEEVRAVKPIASGRNIPILAFSTDWTLAGDNTYIMGFLPFGQIDRIVDYAAKRGYKNTAILSNQDTYGITASNAFENAAKSKGIMAARTPATTPAHDSVFIPAGGQDLMALLGKITNPSIKKLGTGLWDDERMAANPMMNGAWFAAPSSDTRKIFESKYQSTFGSLPIRVSSLAYDATALSIALAKLGETRGSGPAFSNADLTNQTGFLGIDGIMRFNKNGMAERGLSIMEIRGGRLVEIDPAPKRF